MPGSYGRRRRIGSRCRCRACPTLCYNENKQRQAPFLHHPLLLQEHKDMFELLVKRRQWKPVSRPPPPPGVPVWPTQASARPSPPDDLPLNRPSKSSVSSPFRIFSLSWETTSPP